MKKNIRKICGALMALVMLVSLFGGTVPTAQAQEETIVVRLNTALSDWETGYVYWWGAAEEVAWPGVEMDRDPGGVYFWRIPADAVGVLFNNGAGEQGPDLFGPKDGYLYKVGSKNWECELGNHVYVDGICIYCKEAEKPPVENCTVYFDLDLSTWEQVYIYWWNDFGTIGQWPGEPMTNVGGMIFSAQVPGDINGLVFSDGAGQQTENLELPGDGYLYELETDTWIVYDACTHQWNEGHAEPNATCLTAGRMVHSCLLCGEMLTVEIPPLGHDWVDGSCSRCSEIQPEEYTIYYDIGITDWEQVYIYWWRNGFSNGTWPGEPMTHVGGSVYSARIPANVNGLIFNNAQDMQTGNLSLGNDGDIYSDEEGWKPFNGCTHVWNDGLTVKEPTCREDGCAVYTCYDCGRTIEAVIDAYGHHWVDGFCDRCGQDRNALYTIYFDMGFSDRQYVNLYWWADGEAGPVWPGAAMNYEGGSIYSAQVPAYATGIVFNDEGFKDGLGKSPDMKLPEDGAVYRERLGQWDLHNGCGHEWNGGEVTRHATCLDDGLYVYSCANCTDTVELVIPATGHNFDGGACQVCGKPDPTTGYTVYYDMGFSDRNNVNIYWWADATDGPEWPGEIMFHEGGSIYSARVPLDVMGVIFNDGNTQTGDLVLPGDGYVYREKPGQWVLHNGCCHEWNKGVCDLCGEGKTEETDDLVNIYFDNTFLQFETVYIRWYSEEDGVHYILDMIHVGGNVYTIPFQRNTTIWFTDGVNTTEPVSAEDNYLFVQNGVWLPYNGCCHEWNDGDLGSNFDCTQGGARRYTCQSCGQFFEEEVASTNHKVVAGSCTECGTTMEETIEVRLNIDGFNGEKAYVYWWGSEFSVAHPGMEMRRVCATIYSAQIPADANELYFNIDNEVESQILVLPESGMTYVMKTGNWDLDSIHYMVGAVCIRCGHISTGLVEQKDGTYYYQNGVRSDATGLIKYDNAWYYIVKGKLADQTTSLVKYNNEWWYVVDGKVASDMTTLVKWGGEWWYVVKGKIASGTTSLVKYNNEWWYVVNGKIASKTTTLVKYNNEWWYVVNGKIASKTTTLVKYNNEWWYVVKGKIAGNTTTLVQYNGGWYYLVKGKLAAKTTTLVKYNGTWYYVKNGSVDWGYTGNFIYNGGTYRIVKGRVA